MVTCDYTWNDSLEQQKSEMVVVGAKGRRGNVGELKCTKVYTRTTEQTVSLLNQLPQLNFMNKDMSKIHFQNEWSVQSFLLVELVDVRCNLISLAHFANQIASLRQQVVVICLRTVVQHAPLVTREQQKLYFINILFRPKHHAHHLMMTSIKIDVMASRHRTAERGCSLMHS